MPTPIPDKGRVLTALLAALVRARRPTSSPTTCSVARVRTWAPRRRARDAGAPPGHAPDRVRRARLPGRLGLAGLPRRPAGLRPRAAAGPAPGRPAARARSSRRRPRRPPATTSTSRARRRPTWWAPGPWPRPSGSRWRSTRRAAERVRGAPGSSWPTPSSSSGATPTGAAGARRRGAHARLVAPLAGRRVGAGQSPPVVRQAVPARLARRDRLGPRAARPRAAARGGRGHPRAVHRGLRAHHRPPVRRLPGEAGA